MRKKKKHAEHAKMDKHIVKLRTLANTYSCGNCKGFLMRNSTT